MASIEYDDIFNSFLGNITDYNLASSSPSDAYESMSEWLHKAVAAPYINRLFSSVELDDDTQIMSYSFINTLDDELDKDFIVMVLGKQMVYEWIHPRVKDISNLSQFFAGKEQKFYSQAQMLTELRATEEDALLEARRLIRDKTYINNSYLGGGL